MTFTRYYWQLELDERAAARPAATSSPAAHRSPRSVVLSARIAGRAHGCSQIPPAAPTEQPTRRLRRRRPTRCARRDKPPPDACLRELRRAAQRRPGLVPAMRHRRARQPALACAQLALGSSRSHRAGDPRRRRSRRRLCGAEQRQRRAAPGHHDHRAGTRSARRRRPSCPPLLSSGRDHHGQNRHAHDDQTGDPARWRQTAEDPAVGAPRRKFPRRWRLRPRAARPRRPRRRPNRRKQAPVPAGEANAQRASCSTPTPPSTYNPYNYPAANFGDPAWRSTATARPAGPRWSNRPSRRSSPRAC